MNFLAFIEKYKSYNFWSECNILHIKGDSQCPVFLYYFLTRLKEIILLQVETIYVDAQNFENIKSRLETSFLGKKKIYFLQNINSIKDKKYFQCKDYLSKYQGPNIIAFFSDNNLESKIDNRTILLEIRDYVDYKVFLKLIDFLNKSLPPSGKSFIKKVFNKKEVVSLDIACLLIKYATVVGTNEDEFINKCLDCIIAPEKSLFALSQYFFEKKAKRFFELFYNLKEDFSEQFWIEFWSDQLWRAYNVVNAFKCNNSTEIKKISFRLPFYFIKGGWKLFNTKELKNAHDFLYSVDYYLKNGGKIFALDLFYSKFFANQFSD